MMFQKSLLLSLTHSMICALLLLLIAAASAQAQTTTFSYQGRLTDGNTAANGTYEMQFKLFDALTGGTQQPQPTPVTLTFAGAQAVTVSNGIFTVQLDFGASAFPGADRYLEISVKKPADTTYTTLAPRQQLTSTPYAIRSLSAGAADALSTACAGCVTNTQINTVDGSKITGTVANATTATNLSGSLSGDVTGSQSATVVSTVGGETAANIASATQIANAATNANTANAVVRRDSNNRFTTGTLTITGTDARLQVDSPASDNQNLSSTVARFRSYGFNSNVLRDKFRIDQGGGFVALGEIGAGIIPVTGSGERLMWYPYKVAFRAGGISGTQWDDANTGFYSWAGGNETIAKGVYSYAMGFSATASGLASISMGNSTSAGGNESVAMGNRSIADGDFGVAFGNRATVCTSVTGSGSSLACNSPFSGVVSISAESSASSTLSYLTATADNQFNVRAAGGIRLRTATDLSTGCDITSGSLNCTGALTANASNNTLVFTGLGSSDIGTWLSLRNSSTGGHNWNLISAGTNNGEGAGNLVITDATSGSGKVVMNNSLQVPSCSGCTNAPSDRNLKSNFASINNRSVLERVLKLPILTWNYTSDPVHLHHIGPMAQDFFAAFGVGSDDKHINLLDEGGVAFAAIQGLHEELKDRDQKLEQLQQRLESQQQRLSAQQQQLTEQQSQIETLKQVVCLDHPQASVCKK